MTVREQLLCEAIYHITIESTWMEKSDYIYVEDSDVLLGLILSFAEDYVNGHSDGSEEDYLGTIIPYAQKRLFESLGKYENDIRHNKLIEVALFGDSMKSKAAQYALKNNVSLLDFDWWTHAMDVMEYEISYEEYQALNEMTDCDFLNLDITDSPDLLRCLLEIRRRSKQ